LVGGAVRDGLLGIPVCERDWVVVGATAEQLTARGMPAVDRDFPVFRDPSTGDEYALARRETKRGNGYRGFEVYAGPDVTLEEDLRRRDLTVNAIAQATDGSLVDPFNGREDLDQGLLRHVSPAFEEDPVRVLRLARFAAKLGAFGFRVAHPTHRLVKAMVARGDMSHLNAERVWREMVKAMATTQPWRFFEVLHACGALTVLMPELATAMAVSGASDHVHATGDTSRPMLALRHAAALSVDVRVRIAAVFSTCVTDAVSADRLVSSLRADRETAQLLRRSAAASRLIEPAAMADVDALMELVRLWRGLDRPASVTDLAIIAEAQQPQSGLCRLLSLAIDAMQSVSIERLRAQGASGRELGACIAQTRRAAVIDTLRAADLLP
ncbi:MAG: rhodanese, partial [Gammaproteobacteria bacterium]|nr:rhodanese [Gammaproteobacteria bacterium]